MKEVITSCTCDCPDTCSIIATVSGGKVTRIQGNPDFEVTRGFLCPKSAGFLKRVFSPERVLYPLRKEGSGWKRIGWDEAADVIAEKIEVALRQAGPLSLFYFREGGSLAALKSVNERFFNLLGGATFATGSLCGGAGIAGQTRDFGLRTAHDPFDLLNSSLIVIWGRNPAWTNVHLVPILKEARRHGTRLVLIDPVRTATADFVDVHVAPVPGTDGWLAAGMAKTLAEEGLIDRGFLARHTLGAERFLAEVDGADLRVISQITGVSIEQIRELAILYGNAKPAAVVGGWGLQRRRHGAATYRMIDALGALTGNIGVSGGGVSHGMDEMRWFDKGVRLSGRGAVRREIPKPRTGRGLLEATDPAIRVAIVTAGNPLNQCPNTETVRQAFATVDFVVVMDMFMTDTARAADIVLPATHFLQERDVLGSYWHNFVMPVNVAQARLGEEKTDLEAFALIGKRLALDPDLRDDPDPYLESLIRPLEREGITLKTVMDGPVRPPSAVDVPFRDGHLPTASGRFEFVGEITLPETTESREYPYHLISPHPAERSHSQLAEGFMRTLPTVYVPVEVASRCGLTEGARVSVETPQGALGCITSITASLRQDTLVIHEGWWEHLGGSVNRLTPDSLSDAGLSATYNDVMCRIVKAKDL